MFTRSPSWRANSRLATPAQTTTASNSRDVVWPSSAETIVTRRPLVDTALTALDQDELICLPALQDLSAWTAYEAARGELIRALTQSGRPAARYAKRVG